MKLKISYWTSVIVHCYEVSEYVKTVNQFYLLHTKSLIYIIAFITITVILAALSTIQ